MLEGKVTATSFPANFQSYIETTAATSLIMTFFGCTENIHLIEPLLYDHRVKHTTEITCGSDHQMTCSPYKAINGCISSSVTRRDGHVPFPHGFAFYEMDKCRSRLDMIEDGASHLWSAEHSQSLDRSEKGHIERK